MRRCIGDLRMAADGRSEAFVRIRVSRMLDYRLNAAV